MGHNLLFNFTVVWNTHSVETEFQVFVFSQASGTWHDIFSYNAGQGQILVSHETVRVNNQDATVYSLC